MTTEKRSRALQIGLWTVLILLVTALASPAVIGWVADKTIYQAEQGPVAEMKRSGQYRITDTHPGWFSSVHRYAVDLAPGGAMQVVVEDTLTHGPLVLSRLAAGQSPFVMAQVESHIYFEHKVDGKMQRLPMQGIMQTSVDFGGSCISLLLIPAFKHNVGANSVVLDNINGDFSGNCVTGGGQGRLQLPSAYFADDKTTMRADGIVITANMQIDANAMSVGDVNMTVQRFVGHDSKTDQQFTMDALVVAAFSKQVADGYTSGFSYRLGELAAKGVTLKNARLDLELSRLDPAALKKLQDYGASMNKAAAASSGAAPTLDMAGLTDVAGALLAKHPRLDIKTLEAETPDGPIKATAQLLTDAIDTAQLSNPMALMQGITIDADIVAAIAAVRGLVKKQLMATLDNHTADGSHELTQAELEAIADKRVDEQLNYLTAMGVLKASGANYVSQARFANGQLTVNGQPFGIGPKAQ